ncbi:MAG: L,D-transpeptidase family protein [Alphaproteobacteria bacterium]|jgi:L,D-peptidoglycan transpeptidase YkuD (ErfK/YbiS/YcfS/YnhG family)
MRIRVTPHGQGANFGTLSWNDNLVPCVLGRGGVGAHKQEGDGRTPIGIFALRKVLYRSDRGAPPQTSLPTQIIKPDDGWCDDPSDPAYNTAIQFPFSSSAEQMWRADGLYDLVVIIGHNDDPPIKNAGSAIFIHVSKKDESTSQVLPTEGCIALEKKLLVELIEAARPNDDIEITESD